MHNTRYDVLILGSGLAGLTTALHLADHARVAIVAKREFQEGASLYAQGGIAAVLDAQDSIDLHVHDTLVAGAGLCDPQVVRFAAEGAAAAIDWLVKQGVPFTRERQPDGREDFHLTREGGHSQRRVVHVADATGQAVVTTLIERIRAHPNIDIYDNHIAVELITGAWLRRSTGRCLGAYLLDRASGQVKTFAARFVVLATGGGGKVYLYTSNPDVATGDGIALGWRAGCRVANMEFIQFHPTCLYHPRAKSFLISEAVRGEGGRLLLPDGTPFMQRFDARAELAPRDIVARAIDHEMKRLGASCVYLDISHKGADFVLQHFPNIHAHCLEYGFDMTREPLPVVPAAHYMNGGLVIDLRGRTDVEGLYAVGEVSHTGLHGANRMASNSLLECLVFGRAAAADILAGLATVPDTGELPPWDESRSTNSDELVVVSHNWDEVRRFMWDYVGIVRTNKRLQRAKHRVDLLMQEIAQYYRDFRITGDLLELRNLVLVADLIIRSAQMRHESRGLHYTLDNPVPDDSIPPRNTILIPHRYRPASNW
ncbi:L-aspartate oxidase [Gammaproteobacteria bacterium]